METNHLKNAISGLPEIESPDIWNDIERQLPRRKNTGAIGLLLLSIAVLTGVTAIILIDFDKESGLPTQQIAQRNELVALMRYVVHVPGPAEARIINRFETMNSNPLHPVSVIEPLEPLNTALVEPSDTPPPQKIVPHFVTIIKPEPVYVETGTELVVNGDFEDFNICPSGFTERPIKKLIPSWDVPSKGTPDYYNACSKGDAGVPSNFAGRIFAKSGYGYAGLILRESFTKENKITGTKPLDYREYITTELKQPLEKGKTYRIRFWVCNSSKSRYAVDAVGAMLSTEKIRQNDNNVLDYTPTIKNTRGNFLINQTFWVAIEGVYEAKGGEKYLTLGNFNYNYSTLYTLQNVDSKFNYAYYYIDDVSVIEVSPTFQTSNGSNETDTLRQNNKSANDLGYRGEF